MVILLPDTGCMVGGCLVQSGCFWQGAWAAEHQEKVIIGSCKAGLADLSDMTSLQKNNTHLWQNVDSLGK